MKGRPENDLKLEILAFNLHQWQNYAKFSSTNQFCFVKPVVASVYIYTCRQIYCFLNCRLECHEICYCSKQPARNMFQHFEYEILYCISTKTSLVRCPKVVFSIEIMWVSIIPCGSWYDHYLQYSVKKSYRYIKWKLMKGRLANNLKLEILALNLHLWQSSAKLSSSNQICLVKPVLTSVYIYTCMQIYSFLNCRLECHKICYCSKQPAKSMFIDFEYEVLNCITTKTSLVRSPKVLFSFEIRWLSIIPLPVGKTIIYSTVSKNCIGT